MNMWLANPMVIMLWSSMMIAHTLMTSPRKVSSVVPIRAGVVVGEKVKDV